MTHRSRVLPFAATANLLLSIPATPQDTLVVDLNPGTGHGFYGVQRRSMAFGDQLLFVGNNALYFSDGTAAGTVPVIDPPPFFDPRFLTPLGTSHLIDSLTVVGELVYFLVDDGGTSLWRTDGTAPGTFEVANIGNSGLSYPYRLAPLGDSEVLIYREGQADLWKSDGTAAGTVYFLPWNAAQQDFEHFTPAGDLVFFSARTDADGYELWKTDGTAAGKEMVKDINPGALSSTPSDLGVFPDGRVLVSTGWSGLWISDGTEAGTTFVDDIEGEIAIAGDVAFVVPGGSEVSVWVTDGTPGAAQLLAEQLLTHGWLTGVDPYVIGDGPDVLLAASDYFEVYGHELYHVDLDGATPLADIALGGEDSYPSYFVRVGSQVFFRALTPETGYELHVIDMAEFGGWSVAPYGSGCSTGMAPALDASGAAVVGGSLTFEVAGAAPAAPMFLLASLVPDAFELGNGCAAFLTDPEVLGVGAATPSGDYAATLNVPTAPALAGLAFYVQAFAVVPGGPFLGQADLSNGLEVVLGID